MDEGKRVLGVDFGLRRVGVAVSDPMGILARGLETLPNDHDLLNTIVDIVKRMQITKIVIGKPLKLSGEEGNSAVEASKFGKRLKEKLAGECDGKIEIIEWDERFTTTIVKEHKSNSASRKRRGRRKAIWIV